MPASAAIPSIEADGPCRRMTRSAASRSSAFRSRRHASPLGEAAFLGRVDGLTEAMLQIVTVTKRNSKAGEEEATGQEEQKWNRASESNWKPAARAWGSSGPASPDSAWPSV